MTEKQMPIHSKMWAAKDYAGIDAGIRFAVRVLHAHGLDTCQSCQGGKGHAYLEPTVDMVAGGGDADGFEALAVLANYGLPVSTVSITWNIQNGLPFEKLWRIAFSRPFPERADDIPIFEWGYRATLTPKK